MAISDVIVLGELPEYAKEHMEFYSECISGASTKTENEEMLLKAGFRNIKITLKDESREFINDWKPGMNLAEFVVPATIEAVK